MNKVFLILFVTVTMYLIFVSKPSIDKQLSENLKDLKLSGKYRNGGCGFTAYYITEFLEKKNIDYKIVSLSYKNIKNVHLFVRVGNTFIDESGFNSKLKIEFWFLKYNEISKDELFKMIHNYKIWNKLFDFKDTTFLQKIILKEK